MTPPLGMNRSSEREPMMQCRFSWIARPLFRFLRDEEGPTAVEYALMLALIFVVCVSAVQSFGKTTKNSFQHSADKITSAGS